ncbi:hypothetical protein HMPREF2670_18300 [Pseudomonas sp. HMSC072F09]|nr:hypothetical protein HMPREF2670_18300 [Pseudomonas sp. HMSC072F09]
MKATGGFSTSDQVLEISICHVGCIRLCQLGFFIVEFLQRSGFALDCLLIDLQCCTPCCQNTALLCGQNKLAIDALIEMTHKVTELIHAEKRGDQLGPLGIWACSDTRKCINPVLLDKTEAVGVRVCSNINFAGLSVDCSEHRLLKAPGMDVHEISARRYTFTPCLLYVS